MPVVGTGGRRVNQVGHGWRQRGGEVDEDEMEGLLAW
jgi:hypothetical protein